MRGGREDACVGTPFLIQLQAEGRLCPRYDLLEENAVAAELAMLAARVGADHPLWHKLFDLHTQGESRAEALALFYRVIDAISDEGISARIATARERARKKEGS